MLVRPQNAAETTCSLYQPYVYVSPRDHTATRTHDQVAGSCNEREAAGWSNKHVALTAQSAHG